MAMRSLITHGGEGWTQRYTSKLRQEALRARQAGYFLIAPFLLLVIEALAHYDCRDRSRLPSVVPFAISCRSARLVLVASNHITCV